MRRENRERSGSGPRLVIPRALTLIGRAAPLIIAAPSPEYYRTITPPDDALLTACPLGRELFIVQLEAGHERDSGDPEQERAALELREKVAGRRAHLADTAIRDPGPAQVLGPCVICCYDRAGTRYEHYFEAPDQPRVVAYGRLIHIERGRWRLGRQGLEHYRGG